ncbi:MULTISPECIES: hypothetical protein [Acidobacterium]|uniref:hypothetical protein n=1 Tax=Acidobacterium TaxID=33973 RepID=UPI0011D176E8|nr:MULTISPECIES: hypothetical protein [Acidobacterium]
MESMLDIARIVRQSGKHALHPRRLRKSRRRIFMCWHAISGNSEAQKLRRTAAVYFALSSSVSGTAVALGTGTHHSFWFGAVLGFDIVMVLAGIVFLNRAAKIGREQP